MTRRTPSATRGRRLQVEAIELRRSDALARGNRIGSALLGAMILVFAGQRALSTSWQAGIPWPVVASIVWFVGIGAALYAMRPAAHVASPRALRLETVVTSVVASTVIALLGLDLPMDARYLHGGVIALMAGFALLMPMPVPVGGATIAVMALAWPAVELAFGGANPTDPEFLLRIVDIAAGASVSIAILAVHTALFERRYAALADTARLADEDGLTGVLNRRGLVEWLRIETERARRYQRRIGVVMYDVDDFKGFNTRLGYLAGDRMLRAVAETLEGVLALEHFARAGATVGRYGGEEFVVVLPGADAALLRRFAEESRAAVAARRVAWDGDTLSVTVSVGAVTTAGAEAIDAALVAAADLAMYASKSNGGNRVTLATELPDAPAPLHARSTIELDRGHLVATPAEDMLATDDAVRLQLAFLTALLRAACVVVLLYGGVDLALWIHPEWTIDLGRVLPMRLASAAIGLTVAWGMTHLPRTGFAANAAHVALVAACTVSLLYIEELMGLPVPNFFAGMVLVVLAWAVALAAPTVLSVGTLSIIVVGYTSFIVTGLQPGESLIAALMRGGLLTAAAMVALVAQRAFVRLRRDELVLRSRLDRLARLDPLTGLPNRAAFEDRLQREQARAATTGDPLCIGLVDLDHFKALNDDVGHIAGDAALVALADTLREAIRAPDATARIGGEEFAVILPLTDLSGAAVAMRRLLDAIRATTTDAVTAGLRASIGVTEVGTDETPRAALSRADDALREAKRTGRDRVVVHRSGA